MMKLHSKKTAALVALAGMLAAIGIGCTPQINEPVGSNAASGGSTASTTDGSTITDYSDLVSGNSSASTADGSATTGSQGQQQTPGRQHLLPEIRQEIRQALRNLCMIWAAG